MNFVTVPAAESSLESVCLFFNKFIHFLFSSLTHLGGEVISFHGWVVLAVSSNVSTTDFLDRHVLDVEANVVTGGSLGHRLVVHLHSLHLSGQVGGSEVTNIPGFRRPVSTRPTGTVPIPEREQEAGGHVFLIHFSFLQN